MSGYPPPGHGYGYGGNPPPPQPPYSSTGNTPPYGSPASSPYAVPYGAPKPPSSTAPSYGSSPSAPPYGGPPSAPYAPGDYKPPKDKPYGSYGTPPPPRPSEYGSYGGPPPAQSGHGGYGANTPPGSSEYGGYGGPPPPASSGHGGYGATPPPGSSEYGGYGGPPPPASSGHGGYGATPPPGSSEYGGYGAPPRPASSGHGGYGHASYGSPFSSLLPSGFAPGTDPNVVACFQAADQDGSGFIDDKELQGALSSYHQMFSMRTVHLLMYLFTNNNGRKIGPKEFTSLFYSLQSWRSIFERSDKDRSGRIDVNELKDALLSLGFAVSPSILDLLVSKFDKSGGKNRAIEYDNFIECCLTVKGLTEKFKEKDTSYSGSATFTYESFMLTVLPFLIA